MLPGPSSPYPHSAHSLTPAIPADRMLSPTALLLLLLPGVAMVPVLVMPPKRVLLCRMALGGPCAANSTISSAISMCTVKEACAAQ